MTSTMQPENDNKSSAFRSIQSLFSIFKEHKFNPDLATSQCSSSAPPPAFALPPWQWPLLLMRFVKMPLPLVPSTRVSTLLLLRSQRMRSLFVSLFPRATNVELSPQSYPSPTSVDRTRKGCITLANEVVFAILFRECRCNYSIQCRRPGRGHCPS